jgi:hypothetical protein
MLAMFLVGGGILVHGVPFLHHLLEPALAGLGTALNLILPALFNAVVGVVAGLLVLGSVTTIRRLV